MTLLLVVASLALWLGSILLLAEIPWFARRSMAVRLRPYLSGAGVAEERGGLLSVASFRDLVAPLARGIGARVSRVFGIHEDLERRLRRVHAPLDATAFRVRQLGWSIAGLGTGSLLAVALWPSAAIGGSLALGGAALAFLALEHQVTQTSDRWKRSLHLELPVVAEQIGMLLGAGYSLAGALDRVARRGHGTVAHDLRRVLSRVRHGAAEDVALREWAELADVEGVRRLVAVLALNRQASDLGGLIATEARGIRRDVHRELIETLERRGQQVWVPVTVATLLPGAVFVGIPFLDALSGFII